MKDTSPEMELFDKEFPTKTIGHHHFIRERNLRKFILENFLPKSVVREKIEEGIKETTSAGFMATSKGYRESVRTKNEALSDLSKELGL